MGRAGSCCNDATLDGRPATRSVISRRFADESVAPGTRGQIVSPTSRTHRIWILPLLAGIYVGTGKLGLALASVNPSATAVWAPTGVALAALLILGYDVWPGIFAGAFIVNITTAGSLATSLGIATGNTLEGLVGAYLVNRFARGHQAFTRPVDVFRFAGLVGVVATAVSATVGVTTLAATGYAPWSSYGSIWLTWWLGDLVGAITITPLLVLWWTNRVMRWSRLRAIEALALLAILALAAAFVFFDSQHFRYAFMTIPPLVWIAFRLGPRETTTAVILLGGIALAGTLRGLGPFGTEPPNVALVLLQAFVGIVGLTNLVLATAVADRASIAERLRKREAEHRAIAALTSDFAGLWRLQADGVLQLESVTDGFNLVTGYTVAELERSGGWTALVHPDDQAAAATALREVSAGGEFAGDVRVVTRAGEVRWLRVVARPFREGGPDRRVLAAAQDITDRRKSQQQLEKHRTVIRALSTPVLRLLDRLLILPVIGDFDAARAQQLTRQLVASVRTHRARAVVIDLTGVADVEPQAASLLLEAVETTRLLGATAILSGVSTDLAHHFVAGGIDLQRFRTAGDLQAGVDEAQRLLNADTTHAAIPKNAVSGRGPKSSSALP